MKDSIDGTLSDTVSCLLYSRRIAQERHDAVVKALADLEEEFNRYKNNQTDNFKEVTI